SSSTHAAAGQFTPAPSQQPQQPQAAASGKCQPANLRFSLGAKIAGGSSGQPTQTVDLTNEGSPACTMDGYPGVDLVGVAAGQENYTWPIARASVRFAEVTLSPGGTAHFDLHYLLNVPGSGDERFSVVKMVITPPNDFTQAQLTWDQDVVLQDG